jgi:hypothetical protein
MEKFELKINNKKYNLTAQEPSGFHTGDKIDSTGMITFKL